MREKCPNTELFWSVFSCIWTEYRKIQTRNNSVLGHISRSESYFQLTEKRKLLTSKWLDNKIRSIAHTIEQTFCMLNRPMVVSWLGKEIKQSFHTRHVFIWKKNTFEVVCEQSFFSDQHDINIIYQFLFLKIT